MQRKKNIQKKRALNVINNTTKNMIQMETIKYCNF